VSADAYGVRVSTHEHITLRKTEFLRLASGKGLDTPLAIARALKMSHTTVGRVLAGECAPGTAFISRSMHLFGVTFEALFEAHPLAVVA
jgi:transcriptional regulator with XRE-family HTH domain